MKSLSFYLCIFFTGILFSSTSFGQDQNNYTLNINAANASYQKGLFIEAAQCYTKAFISNHNLGRADHRYEAARCWAMGGVADSAFFQLDRSAKGNFSEYFQILTDTAFIGIRADNRWPHVLHSIKVNKQRRDSLNNALNVNLDTSLVATLDAIYYIDQLPRFKLIELEHQHGRDSKEVMVLIDGMIKTDSVNRIKVRAILDNYGWLGKEKIGSQGNATLFLVIQHSDLNTQLNYLPMMKEATKTGRLGLSSYALLEDRVALAQNKPQTYGSQLGRNPKTGAYFVKEMIDPENVDNRRKQVGLQPMKEYVSRWGISWSPEQYRKDLSLQN